LGPLQMFHHRIGEFDTAVAYAKRGSVLSRDLQDAVMVTSAHSLMGIAHFMTGELGVARHELEAALQRGQNTHGTSTIYLGYDSKNLAGTVLASTLWLQGYPAQAVTVANRTVEEAERLGHGLTLALALIWAVYVFVWTGDLQNAQEHTDRLMVLAESRSFGPYLAVGRGFRGQLAILRGDPNEGVRILRDCLNEFDATPYRVQSSPLGASLAQGLEAVGRFSEGLALIDDVIRNVERNGDYCYMPEILRSKARLLLSMPMPRSGEAEACLMRGLELSRRQGARAWELRNASDLATLWGGQGRSAEARALLQPVFAQFSEGLDTADVKAAESLLATL
jgi:tetratricopeptide (TPR) repeat protein